jgi:hypothetical protein
MNFKPKISHEFPLNLNALSLSLCDYDYALVHHIKENEQYANYFKSALNSSRTVILDNSLFELGEAFSGQDYAEEIIKLNPTYYVVPDIFNNERKNGSQAKTFLASMPKCKSNPILVIHGVTIAELLVNYSKMVQLAKGYTDPIIAIPFGSAAFEVEIPQALEGLSPEELDQYRSNVLYRKSRNRFIMMKSLADSGIIQKKYKHHLLGNYSIMEYSYYRDSDTDFSFIASIDTSQPVALSLEGFAYQDHPSYKGKDAFYKPVVKINEVFYNNPMVDFILLLANIATFKRVINGGSYED